MVARIGLKNAKPVQTYFKEWREWKGWTQQELADRMEIAKQTVSRVESGARDWGKGYLEAFSHVIGCPNVTDPITRPPTAEVSLDEIMLQASPEKKKQILDFVEFVLKDGTDG